MNNISLEQSIASALNHSEANRILIEQAYEFKSVFVNRIKPDSSNPRFFPAVFIQDVHAYQMRERKLTKAQLVKLYNAQDKVLIGKGCIVNCLNYGTNEWKKANRTIESILELAENVAVAEIIQVPTLFPIGEGDYQILTGHRRFFALIYVNGVDAASHFKVYEQCPVLPKTKQFQENASREDLPQLGKLAAFGDALLEIEALNKIRKQKGFKALTVRETAGILGISTGAYDNYNVLTRYPAVSSAYSDGCSMAFVPMKKLILKIEQEYKKEIGATVLNATNAQEVNRRIASYLSGEKNAEHSKKQTRNYRVDKLVSTNALMTLLKSDVTTLDTGISWNEVDWDNHKQVKETLTTLVEFLNNRD
ncbi:hypothetical protein BB427_16240 [Pseudoalteromonas sp. BMB]|uniref:ParB/Srx family N-terminal domain-containing protein n=1 Tax=Pseudoalteromonas sp. BMB TaxID=1874619 RepID=UPI00083CD8C7|nr:ParB/Srx family N-terminal domain-containing protein [Pseudoalteromonas sp. BMB]ODB35857.1 hypothetical protein BB427_16240 [Pseudoalteromonas sp. BMB]